MKQVITGFLVWGLFFPAMVWAISLKGVKIPEDSQPCIKCHLEKKIAPKLLEQWAVSKHAREGVGCLDCHEAQANDFDAIKCPDSNLLIAQHPTPKDCAQCHEKEVKEFAKSKHAYPFYIYANADRAIYEPTLATKAGCEQCHNIGILWPDGSVGECDACHPKHTFDRGIARNPFTCGECHLGPDHPHIEIYIESKHGNIFMQKGKNWNLNYKSNSSGIPIEAPVCTTCHMDAAIGVAGTHNVSERLAWESQAPWSYRTVWFQEELGSWKDKRQRMEKVCTNCHISTFVKDYFLAYDLLNLQYNEIRRQMIYWTKKAEKLGLVISLRAKTAQGEEKNFSKLVINAGWIGKVAHNMYHSWHHEGRRHRHGAAMGGADYTQWHGIWELQADLMETICYLAEHGDSEARKICYSRSPSKFFPYKLYDFPGSIWGIWTKEAYEVPALKKILGEDKYWEMVKRNVENAYRKGFLTQEQWERWLERYQHRDHYEGYKYGAHPLYKSYLKRKILELNLKDPESPLFKAVNINPPAPTPLESDPNH